MISNKTWNALLLVTATFGVVALAGCGQEAALEANSENSSEDKVAQQQPIAVETLELRPEAVTDLASLPADLFPMRRAELAAEVSGSVEGLRVNEGDLVARGQLLVSIDTRGLQQQVAEAEAVDRRAQARHQRARRLFDKQSITQQQLLDAVTDRDVAKARLAGARLQLEKSQVRAPWKGKVNKRHIEVGDFVGPGQAVIELIDMSRLKVRAPAPASDVRFLKEGAAVTLRLENSDLAPVSGQIVRLAAELDPNSRTLDIEAEIPNPDGALRPGMYGRLEVVRQTLPEAILVPLDSLLDLGGKSAVFTVRQGQAWRVDIESGPVIGENVVVKSGLRAGDHLVIAGQSQLGDGQQVTETLNHQGRENS